MATCVPPLKQSPEQLVRTLIRHRWSQESIAERIGATQPTVSRILSGRHRNPSYRVVERLRELVLALEDFPGRAP